MLDTQQHQIVRVYARITTLRTLLQEFANNVTWHVNYAPHLGLTAAHSALLDIIILLSIRCNVCSVICHAKLVRIALIIV